MKKILLVGSALWLAAVPALAQSGGGGGGGGSSGGSSGSSSGAAGGTMGTGSMGSRGTGTTGSPSTTAVPSGPNAVPGNGNTGTVGTPGSATNPQLGTGGSTTGAPEPTAGRDSVAPNGATTSGTIGNSGVPSLIAPPGSPPRAIDTAPPPQPSTARPRVALSSEQERSVRDAARNAPVTTQPGLQPTVGMTVPPHVQLQPLPGRLQSALGTDRQDAVFFRTANQIAIVDPSTRQVRNVIPAQ